MEKQQPTRLKKSLNPSEDVSTYLRVGIVPRGYRIREVTEMRAGRRVDGHSVVHGAPESTAPTAFSPVLTIVVVIVFLGHFLRFAPSNKINSGASSVVTRERRDVARTREIARHECPGPRASLPASSFSLVSIKHGALS